MVGEGKTMDYLAPLVGVLWVAVVILTIRVVRRWRIVPTVPTVSDLRLRRFSGARWERWAASEPAMTVTVFFATLGGTASLFSKTDVSGEFVAQGGWVVSTVLLCGGFVFVGAVIGVSTAVFKRPRFAVYPGLRASTGHTASSGSESSTGNRSSAFPDADLVDEGTLSDQVKGDRRVPWRLGRWRAIASVHYPVDPRVRRGLWTAVAAITFVWLAVVAVASLVFKESMTSPRVLVVAAIAGIAWLLGVSIVGMRRLVSSGRLGVFYARLDDRGWKIARPRDIVCRRSLRLDDRNKPSLASVPYVARGVETAKSLVHTWKLTTGSESRRSLVNASVGPTERREFDLWVKQAFK